MDLFNCTFLTPVKVLRIWFIFLEDAYYILISLHFDFSTPSLKLYLVLYNISFTLAILICFSNITNQTKLLDNCKTPSIAPKWGVKRDLKFSSTKIKILNFSRKCSHINLELNYWASKWNDVPWTELRLQTPLDITYKNTSIKMKMFSKTKHSQSPSRQFIELGQKMPYLTLHLLNIGSIIYFTALRSAFKRL